MSKKPKPGDRIIGTKTDLIENYLRENYPHIFRTTKRSNIKKWVKESSNE